jgi:hypothetical protein
MTFPGECEVVFVSAEGAGMLSEVGGVCALFICITSDIPVATDGFGGFG